MQSLRYLPASFRMKISTLPVLHLASFPQPSAQRKPYYVEQLPAHAAKFPGLSLPHSHDFYLLLYVTQGYGTHTIDLITYELKPGSLFFMTPGQVHSLALDAKAQGFIVFFDPSFYLFRYPGSRLYDYPFFDTTQQPVLYLPGAEEEFGPLFKRMFAEYASAHENQADVFRSYLHLCLELAARYYQQAESHEALYSKQQIRAFGQLLNQHFRSLRTVGAYADLLHLSANHLNAVCRRVLNKTASTLIHERVIMEAQRLLSHSAQSVAQIADDLGFDDASYFSRYFRKYTGLTPEAYRQQR